mgnify:CR=1 FL=1
MHFRLLNALSGLLIALIGYGIIRLISDITRLIIAREPGQGPQPLISQVMPLINRVMPSINRVMPLINRSMQLVNRITL